MAEEKVSCVKCGVDFLKTTADCTDGRCMPCFSGNPGGIPSRISKGGKEEEMTAGGWAAVITLLTGLFCLSMAVFPVLGIAVGLIARYGFNSSSNTAWTVGVFTYIGLGVLSSIGDIAGGSNGHESAKNRKSFSKKWAEKHSAKSDDEWL